MANLFQQLFIMGAFNYNEQKIPDNINIQSLSKTIKYMYGNTNMKNWGVEIVRIKDCAATSLEHTKDVYVGFNVVMDGDKYWNTDSGEKTEGYMEVSMEYDKGYLYGTFNLVQPYTGEIRQSKRRKFDLETLKWIKNNDK